MPVDPPRLLAAPFELVGRGRRLAPRLGERLACLGAYEMRDRLVALAQQLACPPQHLRPLPRRDFAPRSEPALSAREHRVGVCDAAIGDDADDLLADGRDHGKRSAGGRWPPRVVDENPKALVHEVLL